MRLSITPKTHQMTKKVAAVILTIFLIGVDYGIASDKKSLSLELSKKEQSTWGLELPLTIFDNSIGDWVVDRFAGNNTTGSQFYQGPAREVGGLQRPNWVIAAGGGTVYASFGLQGSEVKKLMKITADGMLRLVMEETGAIEGPMEICQAGQPVWNPKEKRLYITGPNCLRKIVEKPDGSRWVKLVAGIPGKAYSNREKPQNGPARQATFQRRYRGVVCNSRGTFFWLEDKGLRRIENGVVSSVPLKHLEGPKRFNFAMADNLLSLGEDDDTLYIADFYHPGYRILKCDVKTGELTWVAGINRRKERALRKKEKRRAGKEADGPALTHAGANSGMKGIFHPFYNALWVGGPDHKRLRWLRMDGDGWVRTAFGARRAQTKPQQFGIQELNGTGIPGEHFHLYHSSCIGVDSEGGVYIAGQEDRSGIWRAYNIKAVKP